MYHSFYLFRRQLKSLWQTCVVKVWKMKSFSVWKEGSSVLLERKGDISKTWQPTPQQSRWMKKNMVISVDLSAMTTCFSGFYFKSVILLNGTITHLVILLSCDLNGSDGCASNPSSNTLRTYIWLQDEVKTAAIMLMSGSRSSEAWPSRLKPAVFILPVHLTPSSSSSALN